MINKQGNFKKYRNEKMQKNRETARRINYSKWKIF